MSSNTPTAPELVGVTWKKSSHSGNNQGQCIEVALATSLARIAVRDSKDPGGPALLFSSAAFAALVGAVSDGEFDV